MILNQITGETILKLLICLKDVNWRNIAVKKIDAKTVQESGWCTLKCIALKRMIKLCFVGKKFNYFIMLCEAACFKKAYPCIVIIFF